jgi:hypothetical protein
MTMRSPSFLKRGWGDFTEMHRLKNPPQSPFKKREEETVFLRLFVLPALRKYVL